MRLADLWIGFWSGEFEEADATPLSIAFEPGADPDSATRALISRTFPSGSAGLPVSIRDSEEGPARWDALAELDFDDVPIGWRRAVFELISVPMAELEKWIARYDPSDLVGRRITRVVEAAQELLDSDSHLSIRSMAQRLAEIHRYDEETIRAILSNRYEPAIQRGISFGRRVPR